MRTQRLLLQNFSLAYWAVRRLFELLVLLGRSDRSKEIEILMLRHELHVLKRQAKRPRLQAADRVVLAAHRSGRRRPKRTQSAGLAASGASVSTGS